MFTVQKLHTGHSGQPTGGSLAKSGTDVGLGHCVTMKIYWFSQINFRLTHLPQTLNTLFLPGLRRHSYQKIYSKLNGRE